MAHSLIAVLAFALFLTLIPRSMAQSADANRDAVAANNAVFAQLWSPLDTKPRPNTGVQTGRKDSSVNTVNQKGEQLRTKHDAAMPAIQNTKRTTGKDGKRQERWWGITHGNAPPSGRTYGPGDAHWGSGR